MKALIFAAGLGTRLRPLTDKLPKALVPVGGIPMLGRVIRRIQSTGISDFVINTHHFSDKIITYINSDEELSTHVSFSVEKDHPLETGGGIRNAAPLLCGSGAFLVHNADIFSDADLGALISSHNADPSQPLASLLVCDTPSERSFLFDENMLLRGWVNSRTGEIKNPCNLDVGKLHRKGFCGIHVISERIFDLMADWPEVFSITDFYLNVCDSQDIRGVDAGDITLIDIGSPEKLEQANKLCSL